MFIQNDGQFSKLSKESKRKISNILSNCNKNDIADYSFHVLRDIYENTDEIKEEHDMWRLAYKLVNSFHAGKLDLNEVIELIAL